MPDPIPDTLNLSEQEKEERYVHQVYEAIAGHFSQTRYKPWPVVEQFLQQLPKGAIGVDVGCGNGKYLGVRPDVYTIGSDRCESLVSIAHERQHEVMCCDNLSLPYVSKRFDFALSIAVIHHFTSPERRIAAIKELLRVLRPGGQLLIFVWAMEQKGRRKFDPDHPDVLVPWVTKINQMPKSQREETVTVSPPSSSVDPTALETPEAHVYQRYYHLFVEGELDALVESLPHTHIAQSGYDRDNWYLIITKE
ncbi:S-adenosyl-L-methionine-dependent methyltransferase [Syncephalis fuscata]|nr:S-adenosyl-L-methionine-dependent methyltransferase [Syncephalis fuscata]